MNLIIKNYKDLETKYIKIEKGDWSLYENNKIS